VFTYIMLALLATFALNVTLLLLFCKGIRLAELRRPKP
jgi:hypothetical protein